MRVTSSEELCQADNFSFFKILADVCRMPPAPDSTALTNIMKLVDYVVHQALLKGYNFSNGQVYKRVTVQLEGTVHETPYWMRVKKSEQTRESLVEVGCPADLFDWDHVLTVTMRYAGQDNFLRTVDFVNDCFQIDLLGLSSGAWAPSAAAKDNVADMVEQNFASLSLPAFRRYWFTFKDGEHAYVHFMRQQIARILRFMLPHIACMCFPSTAYGIVTRP